MIASTGPTGSLRINTSPVGVVRCSSSLSVPAAWKAKFQIIGAAAELSISACATVAPASKVQARFSAGMRFSSSAHNLRQWPMRSSMAMRGQGPSS